jgi:hypothetical protein
MKRKRPNTKDRFRAGRRAAEREARMAATGQLVFPWFEKAGGVGFDRPTPERIASDLYVPAFDGQPPEVVKKGGRHAR